jgi:hypothetical protein
MQLAERILYFLSRLPHRYLTRSPDVRWDKNARARPIELKDNGDEATTLYVVSTGIRGVNVILSLFLLRCVFSAQHRKTFARLKGDRMEGIGTFFAGGDCSRCRGPLPSCCAFRYHKKRVILRPAVHSADYAENQPKTVARYGISSKGSRHPCCVNNNKSSLA